MTQLCWFRKQQRAQKLATACIRSLLSSAAAAKSKHPAQNTSPATHATASCVLGGSASLCSLSTRCVSVRQPLAAVSTAKLQVLSCFSARPPGRAAAVAKAAAELSQVLPWLARGRRVLWVREDSSTAFLDSQLITLTLGKCLMLHCMVPARASRKVSAVPWLVQSKRHTAGLGSLELRTTGRTSSRLFACMHGRLEFGGCMLERLERAVVLLGQNSLARWVRSWPGTMEFAKHEA